MEVFSQIGAWISGIFASMEPRYIAAQIFGFLGVGMGILIYSGKTRKTIIISKFISDSLWLTNYIFLGAYTGALLNSIAMARETVFYYRETKKWASHRAWLYVFIALTFLSPIFEWVSVGEFYLLPLLPAAGSVFAVIGFYSKNTYVMRYFGVIAQALWLIYAILLSNISSIICCLLTISSVFIGNIREARARKNREKQS